VNGTNWTENVILRSSICSTFYFPTWTALENIVLTNKIISKGSRVRKHLIRKMQTKISALFYYTVTFFFSLYSILNELFCSDQWIFRPDRNRTDKYFRTISFHFMKFSGVDPLL